MSLFSKLFKILVPFLIYAYGLEMLNLVFQISIQDQLQLVFFASIGVALVVTHIFIRPLGYLAILIHELTHNLLGVLTFNKPIALNVQAQEGGFFAYQGRQNMLSVLSPYFFPSIAIVLFPIYYILSSAGAEIYFGLLGAALGFSFSISLRQASPRQPDFHVFGITWSYLIIILFQLIIWGFFISFTIGRMPLAVEYIKSAYYNLFDLYVHIKGLIPLEITPQ